MKQLAGYVSLLRFYLGICFRAPVLQRIEPIGKDAQDNCYWFIGGMAQSWSTSLPVSYISGSALAVLLSMQRIASGYRDLYKRFPPQRENVGNKIVPAQPRE